MRRQVIARRGGNISPMKSARDLVPTGPYQEQLRQFDLREIDAEDTHSLFHRKYMARLTRVIEVIKQELAPGSTVLEIGCSQANASLLLAEAGYRTIGLDIRADALQYALSKYQHGEFHCVTGSAEALPFPAETFDAVILGELLEHCAEPGAILRECTRPLRSGGIVVVTTPNGDYIANRKPLYDLEAAGSTQLTKYQFGPAGEDHLFAFTLTSLCQVLAAAGFEVVQRGYLGSVVYSDRLGRMKGMFSPQRLELLSGLVNRTPMLSRLLSHTLIGVGRKK